MMRCCSVNIGGPWVYDGVGDGGGGGGGRVGDGKVMK